MEIRVSAVYGVQNQAYDRKPFLKQEARDGRPEQTRGLPKIISLKYIEGGVNILA